MADGILAVLLHQLGKLNPENAPLLDASLADSTTLQDLNLDSLDTLQLAMELEDALHIEIEVVNLPETLTLARVAERLAQAKSTRLIT